MDTYTRTRLEAHLGERKRLHEAGERRLAELNHARGRLPHDYTAEQYVASIHEVERELSAGNPASAVSLRAPGTVGAVRADDLAEALEKLGLRPSAQVVDDALLGKRADEILLGRRFNTMGRDGRIKVPSTEERIELRQ